MKSFIFRPASAETRSALRYELHWKQNFRSETLISNPRFNISVLGGYLRRARHRSNWHISRRLRPSIRKDQRVLQWGYRYLSRFLFDCFSVHPTQCWSFLLLSCFDIQNLTFARANLLFCQLGKFVRWKICSQSLPRRFGTRNDGLRTFRSVWTDFQARQLCLRWVEPSNSNALKYKSLKIRLKTSNTQISA